MSNQDYFSTIYPLVKDQQLPNFPAPEVSLPPRNGVLPYGGRSVPNIAGTPDFTGKGFGQPGYDIGGVPCASPGLAYMFGYQETQ